MQKKISTETQIVTLAAQLRRANNSLRELRASVRTVQQHLVHQAKLSEAKIRPAQNRLGAKTTIECDSGFDEDFYVCAADEKSAVKAAEQMALKEYECGKNCSMSFTLVSAKLTGLTCARGTSEWLVTLTLLCSKERKK